MKQIVAALAGTALFFTPAGKARAAELSAQQILTKVADTYRGLHDYRFEAVQRITLSSVGATAVEPESRFALAVSAPAKIRLAVKGPESDVLVVSDGQTTWWYLPSKKIYTRESAAPIVSLAEEDSEEADPLTVAERILVLRYGNLQQMAQVATLKREDHLKVGGEKIRCYVVELRLPNDNIHQIWIDAERFLVLRHKEESRAMANGNAVLYDAQVELKQAALEAPPAESFAFTPPPGAREVPALGIPGERVSLVGKAAADFSLKDTEGGKVSLSDFRGKVILLDFWATWCPPCREELPRIVKLFQQMKDKELIVFGVNDEGAGTIRGFLKKNAYELPTLVDSSKSVHKLYRVRAIPRLVIINRGGVVVADYVGERSEDELVGALKSAGL